MPYDRILGEVSPSVPFAEDIEFLPDPNAKIPKELVPTTAEKDHEETKSHEIIINLHNSDIMEHESVT